MMTGSQALPGSHYDFSQPVGQQTHGTLSGLNSTLAPQAAGDKFSNGWYGDGGAGGKSAGAADAMGMFFSPGEVFGGNMFDIINWGDEAGVVGSQGSQG